MTSPQPFDIPNNNIVFHGINAHFLDGSMAGPQLQPILYINFPNQLSMYELVNSGTCVKSHILHMHFQAKKAGGDKLSPPALTDTRPEGPAYSQFTRSAGRI